MTETKPLPTKSRFGRFIPRRWVLITILLAMMIWGCAIPSFYHWRFGLGDQVLLKLGTGIVVSLLVFVLIVLFRFVVQLMNASYWGCWTVICATMIVVGVLTLLASFIAPEYFAPFDFVRMIFGW